jgi:hypothetical protein
MSIRTSQGDGLDLFHVAAQLSCPLGVELNLERGCWVCDPEAEKKLNFR